MARKFKKLSDEELVERNEDFMRLNLKQRDNVDFDFEADLIKLIRNDLSINQIVKGNKKHIDKFIDKIIKLYQNIYIKDAIKIGEKQSDRFMKLFTEVI